MMQMQLSKSSIILSIIIALLAAIASAGGIWIINLYNDNDFVITAWRSNDKVTLFVVVPLLLTSIYLSWRGSIRWLLIWMGLMGYMFYNFAFYLFGSAFNIFFLLYVALFSLSTIIIILQLSQFKNINSLFQFSAKTPVKFISIYLLFITIIFLIAELNMIIPFLTLGIILNTLKLTGHHTSEIFALDLSIIIPVSIIPAILLWQRKLWGFIMSIIMLVKGFIYGLVLCLGSIVLASSDAFGKWDSLIPMYFVLTVGGILGCWLLLKNIEHINPNNN